MGSTSCRLLLMFLRWTHSDTHMPTSWTKAFVRNYVNNHSIDNNNYLVPGIDFFSIVGFNITYDTGNQWITTNHLNYSHTLVSYHCSLTRRAYNCHCCYLQVITSWKLLMYIVISFVCSYNSCNDAVISLDYDIAMLLKV